MNKYSNQKVVVDGIAFDSKLESRKYIELKLLEKAGYIKDLELQVKFELQEKYIKRGKTVRSINYIADFVYFDIKKGKEIIVDTKGFRTDVYKLKKKIFEYKYPDLEIVEVRKGDV